MARYSKAAVAEETLASVKEDVEKAYRVSRDPAVRKILKRALDRFQPNQSKDG